ALCPDLHRALSLHDALPISLPIWARRTSRTKTGNSRRRRSSRLGTLLFIILVVIVLAALLGAGGYSVRRYWSPAGSEVVETGGEDRKSTRLNSSHLVISYAV